MANLQVPAARVKRSDSIVSQQQHDGGASANAGGGSSDTKRADLLRGTTGQLGTLIDMLNATAHDPDLDHSDDDDDDDDDSDTEGDEALTPVDSSPSAHDHEDRHAYAQAPPPPPPSTTGLQRPKLSDQGRRPSAAFSIRSLARDMQLSNLEDSEDIIEHARAAREDEEEEQNFGLEVKGDGTAAFPPSGDDDDQNDVTTGTGGDQDPGQEQPAPIDPAVMLGRLVEEYGPWTDDSERFVLQIPGALFRGVLIKGLLALTNRRLFLYALIPPPEPNDVVLKAGPITKLSHPPNTRDCRPGNLLMGKKTRYWCELRSDTFTWFASSAKLYKPIGSVRLSSCQAVLPYDPEYPKLVVVEATNGRRHAWELDTAEAAIQWRNEMEAALFMFRATADKLRLSLPLQYVTKAHVQPYGVLGELVKLEFDTVTPCSDTTGDEQPAVQSVEFGYLRTHTDFGPALKEHIELARALPPCGGPAPILEIEQAARGDSAATTPSVDDAASATTATSTSTTPSALLNLAAQFCTRFALPDKPESLFVAKQAELVRTLPTWGSIAVSRDFVMFWRKGAVGADVMYKIPLRDVEGVVTARAFGFRIFGLAMQIRGSHDVRFDFTSKKRRDEVIAYVNDAAQHAHTAAAAAAAAAAASDNSDARSSNESSRLPSLQTRSSSYDTPTSGGGSGTSTPSTPLSPTSYVLPEVHLNFSHTREKAVLLGQDVDESPVIPPGMPLASLPKMLGATGRRKVSNLHFVCLTIGSRGDVQPYIALALELMKDGNRVTIASHPEYRDWVEHFGIGYQEVGGDPAALMKLSVEHKMFSPGFFKESLGHFRKWLDDLFHESWEACQGADVLIESPSTMAGIHVAEALGIPYFRAFTMPWTSTSAYPQAFASGVDLGPGYNLMSYSLYDGIIWKATAGQVNRWRKKELGLKPTSEKKMRIAQVPFIYNFSSAVVPRPNDWRDNITISGYWFLPPDDNIQLTDDVIAFIQKAREDSKPLIYVGFGSIVVPDAAALTRAVVAAVSNADVRCILSKGWSERGSEKKSDDTHLPDNILAVPSVAHDLLFPLIDVACHHGGAGTTGASLRAGLPTLIHPFFGDQHFWASRVMKSGSGIKIDTLSEKELTAAFKRATTDRVMREKAEAIGVRIRSENGPRSALNFLYDHIHLAQVTSSARAARAAGIKIADARNVTLNFPATGGGAQPPSRGQPARASTLPIAQAQAPPPHPLRSETKLSTQSAPVAPQ